MNARTILMSAKSQAEQEWKAGKTLPALSGDKGGYSLQNTLQSIIGKQPSVADIAV